MLLLLLLRPPVGPPPGSCGHVQPSSWLPPPLPPLLPGSDTSTGSTEANRSNMDARAAAASCSRPACASAATQAACRHACSASGCPAAAAPAAGAPSPCPTSPPAPSACCAAVACAAAAAASPPACSKVALAESTSPAAPCIRITSAAKRASGASWRRSKRAWQSRAVSRSPAPRAALGGQGARG